MDKIFVRTLCGEEFTSFLTQLVNFEVPRNLIIFKSGNFTEFQDVLIEILRKKGWKVETLDTIKGELNSIVDLTKYLIRKKIKRFFITDDDVVFGEKSLDFLKLVGKVLESIGVNSYSIFYATREVEGYTHDIFKLDRRSLLIDFRPAYFSLKDNLKVSNFKKLFRLYGSDKANKLGMGYIYFTSIVSKFLEKVIMIKSNEYGSWHVFREDSKDKEWKFINIKDFEKLVVRILRSVNPNYKLEIVEL